MRFKAIRAELPLLLSLALPLILGELGWMAMSVVDTALALLWIWHRTCADVASLLGSAAVPDVALS